MEFRECHENLLVLIPSWIFFSYQNAVWWQALFWISLLNYDSLKKTSNQKPLCSNLLSHELIFTFLYNLYGTDAHKINYTKTGWAEYIQKDSLFSPVELLSMADSPSCNLYKGPLWIQHSAKDLEINCHITLTHHLPAVIWTYAATIFIFSPTLAPTHTDTNAITTDIMKKTQPTA